MKKLLLSILLSALCLNANATPVVIHFGHESTQAGGAIGSDYIGSGVVFTNAYYSLRNGLDWASGEPHSNYDGIPNQPITGYFVGGTTNSLAATIKYPDGGVTTTLRVFDISGHLVGQHQWQYGTNRNIISILANGIASFEFIWGHANPSYNDDVIGLDDITYEALTPTNNNQSVPEPGTLALLGLGLAGIGLGRRRKDNLTAG